MPSSPARDGSAAADLDAISAYEAPTVVVLGALAELTLGGTDVASSDGWGGAGDSANSIGSLTSS